MPENFAQLQKCRASPKPFIRIILTDIMDCYVRLVRLNDREIEQATNAKYLNDNNHNRRDSIASHQLDHSYSLPQESSDTEDSASDCSKFEEVKPETTESNVDCAASCSLSLGSSPISWSDESEDDNDDLNDTDAITFPPINLEDIDDMATPQSNGEHSNGFVITNGFTNGLNARTGLNQLNGSSYLNGMKSLLNLNGLPNQAMDGEDDDLQFLYGLQEELEQSASQNGTTENCDENGNIWPSIRIFGDVCMKFLVDICFNPYCHHRHELPTIETVQAQLNGASTREILELQNHVLLRYDKLMAAFFETFCMHCGRKWQYHRENLRTMIGPLSKRPLAATYMEQIVDGFIASGMGFSTCVNQLMLEIDSSLNMDDQFNVLWPLIIDRRNEKIVDHLNLYKPVFMGFSVGIVDAINKLIDCKVMGELDDLRAFTVDLVQKCRIDTFRDLNSKLLKGYIEFVRSFDPISAAIIEQKAKQFNFKENDMN